MTEQLRSEERLPKETLEEKRSRLSSFGENVKRISMALEKEPVVDHDPFHQDVDPFNKAYKYIGGVGYFQISIIRLAMFGMFAVGFAQNLISYTAIDPTYMCSLPEKPEEFQQCTERIACPLINQNSTRARMNFEFHSWTQESNLGCGTEHYRDLAKTYYLVGSGSFLFLLMLGTDVFGRKIGFLAVFIVSLVAMVISLTVSNYTFRVAALGISMTCIPAYSAMYTIYFTEILRSPS